MGLCNSKEVNNNNNNNSYMKEEEKKEDIRNNNNNNNNNTSSSSNTTATATTTATVDNTTATATTTSNNINKEEEDNKAENASNYYITNSKDKYGGDDINIYYKYVDHNHKNNNKVKEEEAADDYYAYENYNMEYINNSRYGAYLDMPIDNINDDDDESNNNNNNNNNNIYNNPFRAELIYDVDNMKAAYTNIKNVYDHIKQSEYYKYDWDYRRREIYDRNCDGPGDAKERTDDLNKLNKEFEAYLEPIGKAIIFDKICASRRDEYSAIVGGSEEKMGGLAGGEKIVIGKVIFKFAHNGNNIYSSEMNAQKAAALEIKAYNCIVDCGIHLLNYAMSSIIRYRGYCIVAVAMAPIAKLVYGSCNAAKDIMIDKEAEKIMKQLAEYCHVRGHQVIERSSNISKEIYLGVDVEGHISVDGNFYVLDVARLSSPTLVMNENILRSDKSAYLTRHFRFELLHSARLDINHKLDALSCDAFSGFSIDEEYEDDYRRCKAMMNYLINVQINKLINKLLEYDDNNNNSSRHEYMSVLFKEYGINMRYIPSVAMKLHQQVSSSSSDNNINNNHQHNIINEWYEYLCEEMIVRSFKVHIRNGWNHMNNVCSDVQLINSLYKLLIEFAKKGEYNSWWDIFIRDICIKYNDIEEATAYVMNNKLKEIIYERDHYSLISRILNALNIAYDMNIIMKDSRSIEESSDNWCMKVLIKSVKAPEFLSLDEREDVLNGEIKWRESINKSIIVPLTRLLSVYRLWGKESPDITYNRGDKVVKRLFNIIITNNNDNNIEEGKYDGNELLDMPKDMIKDEVGDAFYEMGEFYRYFGKYDDDALKYYKYEKKLYVKLYHSKHINVAYALNNIAMIYDDKGELDEALKYYNKALNKLGDDHIKVADTLNNIGIIYDMEKIF